MNIRYLSRYLLFTTMSLAFMFGYLDIYVDKNFERLHIFLFNLTSGGFTILYLTEGRSVPSFKTLIFFFLSIIYAMLAFFEIYYPAAAIAVVLAFIVESYRIKKFPFFPYSFFRAKWSASEKFHQASLLCLSIALLLSSFVILNEVHFNLFHFEKLTLNVFFLGFSFPVSLITMSIIFGIIEEKKSSLIYIAEHIFFWLICGGVIVFFLFIIFQVFIGEVIISALLFITVLLIFFFFFRFGTRIQQKHFLVSGMYFLLISAVTGIIYIVLTKFAFYEYYGKVILRMHAFYSLYGWNLTGMMVIIRWNDFPIALNTGKAIYYHWFVILLLAPIAKFYPAAVIPAIISYVLFLAFFFFSKKKVKKIV